ncbi:MAG TPA: PEP-CTERM sorting domain-containing protein [Chthoniobacteraceae bacterium]|nr:PEP-CTERM sorting domain-containing protein [Chthoniobacteraceae bacterium]
MIKTLFYCAFIGSLASGPVLADSFQWTGGASTGNWLDLGNWSSPPPDFNDTDDAIFVFDTAVQMNQSMGGTTRRFDRFEFSAGNFQLDNGTGALTFVKAVGGMVVSAGNHSISAGRFSINIYTATSGGGLSVNNGSLSLSASEGFFITGSKELRYLPISGNGTVTLSGELLESTNGGTLKLRESFTGKLILDTAGSTINLGKLLYDGGGTVRLDADDALGSLTIDFNNAAAKIESGLGARSIANNVIARSSFTVVGEYDLEVKGSVSNEGAGGQAVTVAEAATTLRLSGGISGSLGTWTKAGAGTVVLSGENTGSWSQAIVVEEGILRVENETGSATGSGMVTVQADATLAGNGRVGGATSIHGTLELGEAVPLRFGEALSFEEGSRITLSAGSAPALLEGDLSFGEGVTLVLDAASTWEVGETYRLFELTDGTITGSLTLSGSYTAVWDIQDGPDGYVAFELQAIPEPAHWVLFLSGIALLGWRHRRA